MKIFLIILLVLALLLLVILLSRVEAYAEYWDGTFRYAVRYFGIQVYPFRKKAGTENKPEEQTAEETPKDAEKKAQKEAEKQAAKEVEAKVRKHILPAEKMQELMQTISEKADLISDILAVVPGTLQRLLRAVTLELETDLLIGGEDAADTAVLYGRIQLALQNLLANLGKHIHVKRKNVRIACDFASDDSRWNVRASIKVRIGTAAAAALWFLWHYWTGSRKARKAVISEQI